MILNYERYLSMVKEGLIRTYNIEKYHTNLEIELNSIGINYNINILNKFIYELEILNVSELTNNILNHIIEINQNLLGYYPSYIWVKNNGMINSFKFDIKYLNIKYDYIRIRFESKYEDGVFKNDIEIPEIAYHLSPVKNREKILKNGLCPKSFNRKTLHPERVYLFYDLNDLSNLLTSLKLNDKLKGVNYLYTLYKIDMNKDIIIHTDPNFTNGFYTTDNISPYNIKIIKDNL